MARIYSPLLVIDMSAFKVSLSSLPVTRYEGQTPTEILLSIYERNQHPKSTIPMNSNMTFHGLFPSKTTLFGPCKKQVFHCLSILNTQVVMFYLLICGHVSICFMLAKPASPHVQVLEVFITHDSIICKLLP
jgi:hypothetical protein